MDRDVIKGNKLCYKKERERMKLIHKHNLQIAHPLSMLSFFTKQLKLRWRDYHKIKIKKFNYKKTDLQKQKEKIEYYWRKYKI